MGLLTLWFPTSRRCSVKTVTSLYPMQFCMSHVRRGDSSHNQGHSSHTAPTALPFRRQPRRFRPAPTNGPRTAVTFHEPLAQSVIQSDRWLPKVTRRPIDIKFHWSSIVVRHEQIIMMYVVAIQLYFCITCVPALILWNNIIILRHNNKLKSTWILLEYTMCFYVTVNVRHGNTRQGPAAKRLQDIDK